MVGILIVSHGRFGEALIRCAAHVLGSRPPHVATVGVTARDDPEAVLQQAREAVREIDQGDGVLVLSDICGATPCNIASRLLEAGRVEGLSGVSLPMLIRALTYRNEPLDSVVSKAMSGGVEGVVHLNRDPCHAADRS
ncbi:MAG: PTS sugar transporter subunit IIA [Betaproteobacteria bacterium]|nr:PTS sugar transporter subunit IIA [Betaproteobacteria bacterium]